MRKAFLNLSFGQLHYRCAGQGPPIVMLHPSPLSSTALLPVAAELAKHFRVYALDTPGYGLSDPPPQRPQSLDDYLPLLAEALDALGLGAFCLYGAATGAQIGVEFAKRYPDRVRLLVLDSAGHIPADECERIVANYFPDVQPQKDGRHLVTLWHMVRELFVFFPWCDTRAVSRVDRDLPSASVMQSMLLDYFRAGRNYHWAYRPAFYNERHERTIAVTVPTLLIRWAGSVALSITDALIAAGLPDNFTVLPLNATLPERAMGLSAWLQTHYRHDAQPRTFTTRAATGLQHHYVDVPGGQLHARACLQGDGRPILALHSPAASARLMEPIVAPLVGRRPVIALDLPGNGESDPLLADDDISMESYAHCVDQALATLGVDHCDVWGRYMGGNVGLELSRLPSRRVADLAFLGLALFSPAGRDSLLDRYCPSIAPQWDGGHLLRAWYMMRDQALWFPYFNTSRSGILRSEPNLQPEFLHLRVMEVMKMGDRYRAAYAAEFSYPLAERLRQAQATITLASAGWEALSHTRQSGLALGPAARILDLPPAFGDWANKIIAAPEQAD